MTSPLSRWSARLGVLKRLGTYLWQERLWWMIPAVAILLIFGGLLLVAQSSTIAPFIYTLF